MDYAKSYFGKMIKTSKKYIAEDDEILFTSLYLLLLDFLENKPIIFPEKLSVPKNCHPILHGRYWSMQMACFPKKRIKIISRIINNAKSFDRKNEFFQEIIPVLIILKDLQAIGKIFNTFYEDLTDYQYWDHITIERYNLIALALKYIHENKLRNVRQLLQFFDINKEFHFNNHYQKLFYYIALFHFRKASKYENKLLNDAKKLYHFHAKKLGFKYFDEDFLTSYFN